MLLYRKLKQKHWTYLYPCQNLNPQTGKNVAVNAYAHFRPFSEEIMKIVFKFLSFSHLWGRRGSLKTRGSCSSFCVWKGKSYKELYGFRFILHPQVSNLLNRDLVQAVVVWREMTNDKLRFKKRQLSHTFQLQNCF